MTYMIDMILTNEKKKEIKDIEKRKILERFTEMIVL